MRLKRIYWRLHSQSPGQCVLDYLAIVSTVAVAAWVAAQRLAPLVQQLF